MIKETTKFKVGDKVRYEVCSEVDQGYPTLVGFEGKVVTFGNVFIHVEFDEVPVDGDKNDNVYPCKGEELKHVS